MKLNKESKIVKVSTYGEGYYSGATAYGELYIPYEYYITNKEKLEELEVYVGELDGKHSEVECDVDFDEITVEQIISAEDREYNEDRDIDESIFFRVCDLLELNDEQSEVINSFSNKLLDLDKVLPTEKIKLNLSKDTIIDEVLVPSGTLIEFIRETNNKISDNWECELDFDL